MDHTFHFPCVNICDFLVKTGHPNIVSDNTGKQESCLPQHLLVLFAEGLASGLFFFFQIVFYYTLFQDIRYNSVLHSKFLMLIFLCIVCIC